MGKQKEAIDLLVYAQELPARTRDHQLKGTLKDCCERHNEGDWLLIYRIEGSRTPSAAGQSCRTRNALGHKFLQKACNQSPLTEVTKMDIIPV